MEPRDLWNEWVEPFDLFISYTRKDNDAGMVSALVETIEADFAQFSPSVPLKVFFDKKSILDMQYWQDVLKKGLRQSKVMLAVLSEAYFNRGMPYGLPGRAGSGGAGQKQAHALVATRHTRA